MLIDFVFKMWENCYPQLFLKNGNTSSKKIISRYISGDLEISSDNSNEEASNESHEKAYDKERLNSK